MARFYGTVDGRARSQASRLGTDSVKATARGWDIGAEIVVRSIEVVRTPSGKVKDKGRDIVELGVTGGSRNQHVVLSLGTWACEPDGTLVAWDETAATILRGMGFEGRRLPR